VKAFSSLDLFYERRRRSAEIDYGACWRWGDYHYQVSWLEQTGELIAIRLGPTRLARRVAFDVDGFGGEPMRVYVIAVIPDRDVVDALLDGWLDTCGLPGSLGWLTDRVHGLPDRDLRKPLLPARAEPW
jgi:hypothetical protein